MECECFRCGHKWVSKSNKKPQQCPKCKQYYYDKPAGWEYTQPKQQPDVPITIREEEQKKDGGLSLE